MLRYLNKTESAGLSIIKTKTDFSLSSL